MGFLFRLGFKMVLQDFAKLLEVFFFLRFASCKQLMKVSDGVA